MAFTSTRKRSSKLAPTTVEALKNLDDFHKMLESARASIGVSILSSRPKEGITVVEYATKFGLSTTTARYQLTAMVDKGTMKCVKAMVADANGRCIKTNCFIGA